MRIFQLSWKLSIHIWIFALGNLKFQFPTPCQGCYNVGEWSWLSMHVSEKHTSPTYIKVFVSTISYASNSMEENLSPKYFISNIFHQLHYKLRCSRKSIRSIGQKQSLIANNVVYLGNCIVIIVAVFQRFFESEFPWTFLFILVIWDSTNTWYKWYNINNHHVNHKIHYCYLYRGRSFHVISWIVGFKSLVIYLSACICVMKFMQFIMVSSNDRLFRSNYTFISKRNWLSESALQ